MLTVFILVGSVLLILKSPCHGLILATPDAGVILTANNRSLPYVTTDLTAVNYDGEARYTFVNGEDLEITCRGAVTSYFTDYFFGYTYLLHLEYYNSEGMLLFKTDKTAKKQIFRSVLTTNYDKYYLDCVLLRKLNDKLQNEYRYRTTFHLMNDLDAETVDQAMTVSVNGQDLIPIDYEKSSNNYVYKYVDGEILDVKCRKTDPHTRGSLVLSYYSDRPQVVSYSTEVSLKISTSNITFGVKTLTCFINNSNVNKPNARLSFVSDVPENDVRILGLPKKNILYQYKRDENRWTVEYQYAEEETVNLTCVAKGGVTYEEQYLKWAFNGNSFDTVTHSLQTTAIVSNQGLTRTLKAIDNAKNIRCIYISRMSLKTAEIILRLKPEATSGEIISAEIQSDGSSSVILGSCIGAVLVLLGMASVAYWCILLARRRNHRPKNETSCVKTAGDSSNQNGRPKQSPDECENQYESCYNENQTELCYDIPANVGNSEDNYYTEIDISSRCRPIDTKTNDTLIYDEPYVHFTMRSTMNTYRV